MPSPPPGQRLEPPTPHPKAGTRLLVFQWGELEVDLYLYFKNFLNSPQLVCDTFIVRVRRRDKDVILWKKIDFPTAGRAGGTSPHFRGAGGGGRPPGAKLFWSLGAFAAGELFINRTSPAPRLQRRNKGDQNFPGATRPLPGVETGGGADGSALEWRPRSHSSAPPPTQTFSHQDRWGMTGHPGPQSLHL